MLNAIYEQDFLGFSYRFRSGRSPHQALDALAVGNGTRKVKWVLDADIRRFYDTLDHGWLVKFVEHRVADRRVLRLIQKWFKAGVLEEGKRIQTEVGAVRMETSAHCCRTSTFIMCRPLGPAMEAEAGARRCHHCPFSG